MNMAAIELQKAIFAALKEHVGLAAKVGDRIHDLTPGEVQFPYVTFGQTSFYDWSTGTEIGTEHLFTLHVWSKVRGKSETVEIMGLMQDCLHNAQLVMNGHHLVNLTQEYAEARLDEELLLYRGLIRYRAVTEPKVQQAA